MVYNTEGEQIPLGWLWQIIGDWLTNWSVEGDIGTIKQNGLFKAKNPGTGTVHAVLGNFSASAPLLSMEERLKM